MVIYRVLIYLLLPAFWLYTLKRRFSDGDQRYFLQRCGWALPRYADQPLWVHCASVGEVQAVAALVDTIHEQYPEIPVVVSTVTPTGAAMARKVLPDQVAHVYLPFDSPAAVRRFVRHLNPRAALIMETEIWPNLFTEIGHQKIPLVIINGRLSDKTLNTKNWMKAAYRASLKHVTRVLAKNPADGAGFIQLGTDPDKVDVLGNLKFARQSGIVEKKSSALPRPYWLAASTHEGEERLLADIQQSLKSPLLLVIAPRHPERSTVIQGQLKAMGILFSVRSKNEPVTAKTQIYLADTLGEMRWLMKFSQCVFMGGSLVPVGGHNLLEPAALGCPIIVGSSVHNVEPEVELLREHQAILEVPNAEALKDIINTLSHDPTGFIPLGQAASQAFHGQQGVLARYLRALEKLQLFSSRQHGF